jgi:hypothetical protein
MGGIGKIKNKRKKTGRQKVVGFFAIRTGTPNILCDGDACVIGGSKTQLQNYIQQQNTENPADYTIKKTTYAEIRRGMKMGGAYAFDLESYGRFRQLAMLDGENMTEFNSGNDTDASTDALHLMRVQWFNTA